MPNFHGCRTVTVDDQSEIVFFGPPRDGLTLGFALDLVLLLLITIIIITTPCPEKMEPIKF